MRQYNLNRMSKISFNTRPVPTGKQRTEPRTQLVIVDGRHRAAGGVDCSARRGGRLADLQVQRQLEAPRALRESPQ